MMALEILLYVLFGVTAVIVFYLLYKVNSFFNPKDRQDLTSKNDR
jgi:hypothetical protein